VFASQKVEQTLKGGGIALARSPLLSSIPQISLQVIRGDPARCNPSLSKPPTKADTEVNLPVNRTLAESLLTQ